MAGAVASAFVEVVPDFQKFRGAASSEMSSILGRAGDGAGARAGVGINSGVLGGIGKLAGPLTAAFAALGIGTIVGNLVAEGVRFGFEGIDLASDLGETRSAVSQVFGGSAKDIEKFASTANKKLGQTQQQALNAATDFGVFGDAAGLTGKDLSGFSTDLVSLGTDLASFKNTSPQEALDALSAGLRGEAEPLRKYGILLDDAALKAKAFELGIFDGTGSLDSQQRILAANAVIFDKSAIAQGDFERTSGGLAGQQKILAASFEEAKTKLGTSLLPALTTFVTLLNKDIIPVLGETIDQVGPVLADALEKAAPAFGQLLTAIAPLLPELVKLGVEVLPPLLDFFIAISPFLIDFVTNQAGALSTLDNFFKLLAGDITLKEFGEDISELGGSVADAARKFGEFTGQVVANLVSFATDVGTNIGSAVTTITEFPGKAIEALADVGTDLYESGRALIQGFIDGINAMLEPVTDAVDAVMSGVADFFPNSPAKRGPFSGTGWSNVKRSGQATFDQFAGGFNGAADLSFGSGVNVAAVTAGAPSAGVFGSATAAAPIYVQNPFTGEYLLAQVGAVADGVVSAASSESRRVLVAGKR